MSEQHGFEVGDVVWVTQNHYSFVDDDDLFQRQDLWEWERGEIVAVPAHGRTAWFRVRRLFDGRVASRDLNEIRQYDAINQLADLVRCPTCRDRGFDRCQTHSNVNIEWQVTAASASNLICINATTTTSSAEDSAPPADDNAPVSHRRRLSDKERAHRRKRRRIGKRSRSRNR